MGSVALLAQRAGHKVTGSDEHTYPPMSTLLESVGIQLTEGYHPDQLDPEPDLVIIGNALGRGNPAVEHVLNQGIRFISGPRWLGENYLANKKVIAVAGTHGKTTTSSLVAWILESAGLNPGFLIGGVPLNFNLSARDGEDIFVVEADEYDTAFFDKRAKFVHYLPDIAILNNLEYDHADIYPDLSSIQTQFHHLVLTVPGNGTIISNAIDTNLEKVLERGCWSNLQRFSLKGESEWQVKMKSPDGQSLEFFRSGESLGSVQWESAGQHNAQNACSAIAASVAAGVDPTIAISSLATFKGVKRRMELLSQAYEVFVYDDFAHHPTAIRLTLEGMRRKVGNARILVALEPRSNTMRSGVHSNELGPALLAGDFVWLKTSKGIDWDPQVVLAPLDGRGRVVTSADDMLDQMMDKVKPGDHVVFMSNGGFDSAPARFSSSIQERGSVG